MIDLGFGNPDLPSPDIAVDKLSEAAHNTRNHRYSSQPGHPEAARGGRPTSTCAASASTLDPDTEVINTIGAKEGFSPPDVDAAPARRRRARAVAVATRSTSTGRCFAGADIREVPLGTGGDDFFDEPAARPGSTRGPSPGSS